MGKRKRNNDHYAPLKILPVPVSKIDHPPPPNQILPKHEFTMGLIAPKGAGKTTTMCNLLHFYRGYFHTILIFSPTIHADEKWKWVKQQNLLVENVALKRWIKKEEQKRRNLMHDKVVQNPPLGIDLTKIDTNEKEEFDGLIPEECFFDEYDEMSLKAICDEQMAMVETLEKHGQTKHMANRILMIFDDLVGSDLFSLNRKNFFKGFNTRHRHYSASLLMVSQGYKEIPKTVRTNWTCLLIYEIANDKEIEVIWEENTMGLKHDPWVELYQHAVAEDYSFLYLNSHKPKGLRCMKNFEKILFYNSTDGKGGGSINEDGAEEEK